MKEQAPTLGGLVGPERLWQDVRYGCRTLAGAGTLLRAAFPSGNNERDITALLIVIPIVLAVTFLAAYLPARRASRVNPVQALRYE